MNDDITYEHIIPVSKNGITSMLNGKAVHSWCNNYLGVLSIERKKNISKVKLPVQGKIVSNYGEGKDIRKSKNGVVFKVFEESFVTSPINGMVVYANQFRSYGNLIIIENEEGYYCILSGMKKIIISSGNEVFMGEPIAKISAENNSQLYFELRLNGKIINPKSKVEIL